MYFIYNQGEISIRNIYYSYILIKISWTTSDNKNNNESMLPIPVL